MIYISCSLESFQKEVAQLMESGWSIADAAIYWLFPGTEHIELVAKLQRATKKIWVRGFEPPTFGSPQNVLGQVV
jgi:hypothetical protein